MKKISIRVEVNVTTDDYNVDINELGYNDKEWKYLSDEEKEESVERWIFDLTDQPYWMLDTFDLD